MGTFLNLSTHQIKHTDTTTSGENDSVDIGGSADIYCMTSLYHGKNEDPGDQEVFAGFSFCMFCGSSCSNVRLKHLRDACFRRCRPLTE